MRGSPSDECSVMTEASNMTGAAVMPPRRRGSESVKSRGDVSTTRRRRSRSVRSRSDVSTRSTGTGTTATDGTFWTIKTTASEMQNRGWIDHFWAWYLNDDKGGARQGEDLESDAESEVSDYESDYSSQSDSGVFIEENPRRVEERHFRSEREKRTIQAYKKWKGKKKVPDQHIGVDDISVGKLEGEKSVIEYLGEGDRKLLVSSLASRERREEDLSQINSQGLVQRRLRLDGHYTRELPPRPIGTRKTIERRSFTPSPSANDYLVETVLANDSSVSKKSEGCTSTASTVQMKTYARKGTGTQSGDGDALFEVPKEPVTSFESRSSSTTSGMSRSESELNFPSREREKLPHDCQTAPRQSARSMTPVFSGLRILGARKRYDTPDFHGSGLRSLGARKRYNTPVFLGAASFDGVLGHDPRPRSGSKEERLESLEELDDNTHLSSSDTDDEAQPTPHGFQSDGVRPHWNHVSPGAAMFHSTVERRQENEPNRAPFGQPSVPAATMSMDRYERMSANEDAAESIEMSFSGGLKHVLPISSQMEIHISSQSGRSVDL